MTPKEEYMSTASAPGTCCPEMKIIMGVCQGCGYVWDIGVPIETVISDIQVLSMDQLMALDHTLTNEFIRRMKEDKGMEART